MKEKTWFEKKLEEFKDDPEFLREKIQCLSEEIDILNKWNDDLANALIVTKQDAY